MIQSEFILFNERKCCCVHCLLPKLLGESHLTLVRLQLHTDTSFLEKCSQLFPFCQNPNNVTQQKGMHACKHISESPGFESASAFCSFHFPCNYTASSASHLPFRQPGYLVMRNGSALVSITGRAYLIVRVAGVFNPLLKIKATAGVKFPAAHGRLPHGF